MEDDDASKPFYRAILALRSRERLEPARIDEAVDLVDDARRLLHGSFAALVAESYKRAYGTMVTVQQLAELEEIVGFGASSSRRGESRRSGDARRGADAVSDHRAALVARWRRRLAGCPHDVAVWQRVLNVRALVLSYEDDPDSWLRYASLCRHSGNAALSESVLTRQLGFDPAARASADRKSTVKGPQRDASVDALRSPAVKRALVAAAGGFVRAIALGRRRWAASVQQDLLNLLNLWFRFARQPEVEAQLLPDEDDRGGVGGAPLDAWLGVLPQLIARIGAADASPKSALHRLLARLGARHPQALVYPLSLQLKSPRDERRLAAEGIMQGPRTVAPRLVDQAPRLEELIRVAILWHEKWHEGLEEASRLYFGDGDVDAMLQILRPLHAELSAGPTTLREAAFQQAFGRDLGEAAACLDDYERHARAEDRLGRGGDRGDGDARRRLREDADAALNQAWDLYYTVFRRVNKQLPQLTTLELRYVSPALLGARSLDLAVPGTYRVDGAGARISRFSPSVHVITSKQRPRRLAMKGEDGREYGFLLKGHEDLRQDESAMQLFGLANALLAKDRRTREHGHLSIQRYAVTPLSHNCGVVGWVPACDTLHALVRDFRDARKIVLNVEHRVMLQLAPDYDALSLPQKVEVFDAALANTAGHDLSKVLWLKSSHSEQWLERRTHYARSLAAMSMVGHILGLGDRHPSNLMLDRRTGKVLHIDFGDCLRSPCTATSDNRDSLLSMLEAFIHDPLISWRLLGAAAEPDAASPSPAPGRARRPPPSSPPPPGPQRTSRRSASEGSLSRATSARSSDDDDDDDDDDGDGAGDDGGAAPAARARRPATLATAQRQRRRGAPARARSAASREQMHVRMQRMAASLTGNSTRHSALAASQRGGRAGSVANSRLDHRSARESLLVKAHGAEGADAPIEALNEKALAVMARVQDKLSGCDFRDHQGPLAVADQVDRLIAQSTDVQNLCQSFVGWCPFW
ncbi:phosphatidylinositol kinase [Aureococcus anophagefferens]|nr:phosphatidylinositol kinase [Aureococcus anophagefferens]